MALLHFTGILGTNWNEVTWKNNDPNTGIIVATNWTGNAIPGTGNGGIGPQDDLIIDQSQSVAINYYSLATNGIVDTVASLSVTAGSSLSITSATLTLGPALANDPDNPTGYSLNNAGVISAIDSKIKLQGLVVNNGQINMLGGGHYCEIAITGTGMTLTGTGVLNMPTPPPANGYSYNVITGSNSGATVTLENYSTISGQGFIGYNGGGGNFANAPLIVHNHGIINGSDTQNILTIQAISTSAANALTNDGTLEATAGGGLTILGAMVVQSGGGVVGAYGAGSAVTLAGVNLQGGLIDGSGGGVVQTGNAVGPNTLDGRSVANGGVGAITIGANGNFVFNGGPSTTILGSVVDIGKMTIAGGVAVIGAGDVTLSGAGNVVMAASTYNESAIMGYDPTTASTLHNVDNTISGMGTIGIGRPYDASTNRLILDNQAAGVINANDATNALTLNMADAASNAGLIEATGAGGLAIQSTTIVQSGTGSIAANGSGAHVDLYSAVIAGGMLSTSGGGVIQTKTINSNVTGATLDGSTAAGAVTNAGAFIAANGDLTINGSIINTGTISLAATMVVGPNGSTLSGAGSINMALSGYNQTFITGSSASVATTLHNASTISGMGTIGTGRPYGDNGYLLVLDNQAGGAINANDAVNSLTLHMTNAASNAGIIESTDAGGLNILNMTVNQSGAGAIKALGTGAVTILDHSTIDGAAGGLILASGAGALVSLTTATIRGGLLQTANGGFIVAADTGSLLDGSSSAVTVAANSTVKINDGKTLTIKGSIVNHGTFALNAPNSGATLQIEAAGATLSGGGTIALTDGGAWNNFIAGGQLTNVDNTISGTGYFNSGLKVVNQSAGVINASSNVSQLVIKTGTPSVANSGMIKATGSQGLLVQNSTVDNAGGGIMRAETGSHIDLTSTGILGGTLQSAGTGFFQVLDSVSQLAGVTTSATINIAAGRALSIGGATVNSGVINVIGTASAATLYAQGTWTGAGRVNLSNASGSTFSLNGTFVNSDNVISGSGTITGTGAALVTLTNNGTIDAIYSANALTVNTHLGVVNNGVLEGNGGTLLVNDAVTGTGSALITNGGAVKFAAAFDEDVAFQGANAGTLYLATTYGGVISGFNLGDTIDLTSIGYAAGEHMVLQSTSNHVEIFALEDSSNSVLGTFRFSGNYQGGYFTVSNAGGQASLSLNQAPSASQPAPHDFNGDGTSDIALQSGGTIVDYLMSNGTLLQGKLLATGVAGYNIVGTGDFNGDGVSDILLQNGGTLVDYLLQNGTLISGNLIANGLGGYSVAGTGDFNGDGTSDILLQNGGTLVDYQMSNGAVQTGKVVATGVTGYSVVGTGDFNGDGTTDILLQNGGTLVDYQISNGAVQTGKVVATGLTGYSVVGTGDFNADGTTDILLQNGGTLVDYLISNGSVASGNLIAQGLTGYSVAGTGDFNADGYCDILLQNSGTLVDYLLGPSGLTGGKLVATGLGGYVITSK